MADSLSQAEFSAATLTDNRNLEADMLDLSLDDSDGLLDIPNRGARLRVATKYPHIAREHFSRKGVHVDIIKLYGSMELAPLVGLADAIVDLVSTGNTLRANQLVAVEHIEDISSRLVVNLAALKLKHERIRPLLDAFAATVAA